MHNIATMKYFSINKTKRIFLHFFFWIGVWFFYVYFFSYNSSNEVYPLLFSAFLLPITISLSYFLIYYLIPKYLLVKKYKLFALYSVYTFIISTYFIVLTMFASLVFLSKLNFENMPLMSRNFIFILILVYLVAVLISFVSLLNQSFTTISKNKELQNKVLETQLIMKEQELLYLKNQIHPHFLFNSLNTLYGLALNESKETPELILKLSNLLDYILYQINKPYVSLSSEIEHVREYIELEKIRFHDSLTVNYKLDEVSDNLQIAPMLIIPLVENAFKHGTKVDGRLFVDISLVIENEDLIFTIKNSFVNNKEETKHGIGLTNLKKRLEHNYQDNFELSFKTENDSFIATLKLFNLNNLTTTI